MTRKVPDAYEHLWTFGCHGSFFNYEISCK